MTIIADDLFAGAGGWDLAAKGLGITARGVENMPEARATRDAAGLDTIHDDVWTFVPDGKASMLIASPPCPTFSPAGSGSGRVALPKILDLIGVIDTLTLSQLRTEGEALDDDDRTALVLAPLWFALNHPYRTLAWEQVSTVLPIWEACAEVLRAQGWSVWTGKVHSEQYGTPQSRTRALLLASLDGEAVAPTPTHSKYHTTDPTRLDEGVYRYASMSDVLGWDADTEVISNYGTGGDPAARGVRTADQPAATVTSKVNRNKVRFAGAGRTSVKTAGQIPRELDQPAHTITGKATAAWVAGDEARQVTVAEAGVLQGFPADYPWQGRSGKQYLQAGNAVPVQMAAAALETLI